MVIGILALQGNFAEHKSMLDRLGIKSLLIRQNDDLNKGIDGIILPGGESTTMLKLLHSSGMFKPLKALIETKKIPTLATCAGLILLAQKVVGENMQTLGSLPVEVKRNAFGRQSDSFVSRDHIENLGVIPMVFIRAPYIAQLCDPKVKILGQFDGNIIAVQYQNQIGMAFHPELTDNFSIHQRFIEMVQQNLNQKN